MRHRIDKKFFNRDTKSRRSLLNGVVVALFEHGEILTTQAKGKEGMRLAESVISQAKIGDLNARRNLHRIFGRRDVVNNITDRVAPLFQNRQSGFCRLMFVGNRRGDNTPLYRLSLVETLPASKKSEKAAAKVSATQKKASPKHDNQSAKQAVAQETKVEEKMNKKADVGKKVTRRLNFGGGRGK